MGTASCYRWFCIVRMLHNGQELLLFRNICVDVWVCVCVCVHVCVEWWGGVQISVGAPVCVIKRNCDKDRKRERRPQAAHYQSTTITRNPSEDKCPLTAPLISMEAGGHLTQHGKTSLTDTQDRHTCNTWLWLSVFLVAETVEVMSLCLVLVSHFPDQMF